MVGKSWENGGKMVGNAGKKDEFDRLDVMKMGWKMRIGRDFCRGIFWKLLKLGTWKRH